MLQLAARSATPRQRRLSVRLAHCDTEILEAQRLRYRVFAEELGARLTTTQPGVDRDLYDRYCEHLIVRDEEQDRIVGTYRILSPRAARKVGNYYSENEFDLVRLQHLRPSIVEVGRSCIDPAYRTGATIALLWSGLTRYMMVNDYGYLMGCASIGMRDGGHAAAAIYARLGSHLAPLEYRVRPRCPLPLERLRADAVVETPPLIRGYLRAGAYVCGEPAWDPDFNTADLLLLLPLSRLDARYARHFIERRAA